MGLAFRYPGWTITHGYTTVTIKRDIPVGDRDGDGAFAGYHDSFATLGMSEQQIIERVFATLQYLNDHELREQFTVNGMRVFDAHDPVPLTGLQKEWFVERQSAVKGF